MTDEEKSLLQRLATGVFDGMVGNDCYTNGGSRVWTAIKDGTITQFKQGPGSKYFDGKENVRVEGVLHVLRRWRTDEEKIEFFRRFGFLLKDTAAKAYSAKFKPKR